MDAVTVEDKKAVLRLANPVYPGVADLTVTYTRPTASRLRGIVGAATDEADGFSHQTVTHGAGQCVRNSVAACRTAASSLRPRGRSRRTQRQKPEWFTVAASGGPVTVTGAAFSPDDPHVPEADARPRVRPGRDREGELPPPGGQARTVGTWTASSSGTS